MVKIPGGLLLRGSLFMPRFAPLGVFVRVIGLSILLVPPAAHGPIGGSYGLTGAIRAILLPGRINCVGLSAY